MPKRTSNVSQADTMVFHIRMCDIQIIPAPYESEFLTFYQFVLYATFVIIQSEISTPLISETEIPIKAILLAKFRVFLCLFAFTT